MARRNDNVSGPKRKIESSDRPQPGYPGTFPVCRGVDMSVPDAPFKNVADSGPTGGPVSKWMRELWKPRAARPTNQDAGER